MRIWRRCASFFFLAADQMERTASLERTGRASPASHEPDACGILERTASLEHGGAALNETAACGGFNETFGVASLNETVAARP